jgi:type VI secretion system (T6SS) effector TldE1-like protein
MSWTYEITTGRLYDDSGVLIGVGYSGDPQYKNNATAQSMKAQGPIPEGSYMICQPEDSPVHGPFAMPLNPDPSNLMWGRSGFMMHGDSVTAPGTASEGCVIMSRDVRESVWNSMDHTLVVVAQKETT